MLIGLSYSRCILDIVEKKVQPDNVLVIIARTNFDPRDDKHWSSIWRGYCKGSSLNTKQEWQDYDYNNTDHENLFRKLSIDLYESGKIHQPRQFGANVYRLPYHWLQTLPSNEEIEKNPALKKSYEQFLILAGLSNNQKEYDYN